ncbi:MAG: hypothetical protein IKI30_08690 [Oxalobacter sp.]|nr:hypothetical protein [Oxalobacter sp.]
MKLWKWLIIILMAIAVLMGLSGFLNFSDKEQSVASASSTSTSSVTASTSQDSNQRPKPLAPPAIDELAAIREVKLKDARLMGSNAYDVQVEVVVENRYNVAIQNVELLFSFYDKYGRKTLKSWRGDTCATYFNDGKATYTYNEHGDKVVLASGGHDRFDAFVCRNSDRHIQPDRAETFTFQDTWHADATPMDALKDIRVSVQRVKLVDGYEFSR